MDAVDNEVDNRDDSGESSSNIPTADQNETAAQQEQSRKYIVEELLSTERSYVKGLSILVKTYLRPIESACQSKKPLVPIEKVRQIFSIADVILNYHSMFLETLTKRVLNWSATELIGDLMLEMVHSCECNSDLFQALGLKLYSEYVNNYSKAIQTLNECNKNKNFSSFLLKIKKSNNVYDLEYYLVFLLV